MPVMKKLRFIDGVDVTAPSDISSESSTTHISEYVDDAAFVTANGAATAGDVYINTTFKCFRIYTGAAWRNAIMSTDAADPTKTFEIDLSGATTGKKAKVIFPITDDRDYTFQDEDGIVPVLPIVLTSEVSGALPVANGGTGGITPQAARTNILPSQTGNLGKYLKTDGTDVSWATVAGGGGGSESVLAVTNNDYTVLDADGYTTFLFSTGATDRTLTLPVLANNVGRVIRIKKIDSGVGKIIIDGDSAETIEGALTLDVLKMGDEVEIQADSQWYILQSPAMPELKGTVYGSKYTNSLTIANVSGLGGMTTAYMALEAYQTYYGQWKLRGNFMFVVGSGTANNVFEFSISNVTFKDPAGVNRYQQPVMLTTGSTGFGQIGAIEAYTMPGTGNIKFYTTNSPTPNYEFNCYLDVELDAKPSWV